VGVLDADWLAVEILLVDWLVCANLDANWLLFSEDLGVHWLSEDLGVDWLACVVLGVDWLEPANESAGDGLDFAGLRADWLVCGVRVADWLRRAANWLPICRGDGFAEGVTAFKGFWKI
jgi:hypothetical protein